MKHTKTIKTLSVLATIAFMGCAKEKPYDVQYKEVELLSRNQIVTEETVQLEDGSTVTRPVEYVYVPMTLGTPMNVTDADPFYQGQEKVVRLQWAEEGLEVVEIERDRRFADNDLNEYPVLTIPGAYKDYRCREDAYGECTNAEEENTEVEWYDKKNFLPELENLKVKEVNELDIFTLNNASCLSEGETKVVNYEITPGVINVELEKNYKVSKADFFCFFMAFFDDQLKTSGFRVRKYFSLVRLDKLATPGYQPVVYNEPDRDDFGFFAREEKVLTGEFDRQRPEKRDFMERWNPGTPDDLKTEKNEYSPRFVEYYLSPEYSKPENDYILQATKEAVALMNQEMFQSKVPLQIKLIEQKDPKKAVSPGDLRYTSLVLIEDPLANGLLGYGPAVSNPYTGEIIKAHTNMYLGVLKSMTRWVYQAAVDITNERAQAANQTQNVEDIKIAPEALENLPESLALAHFPELIAANMPKPPVVEPTPTPTPGDQGDTNTDDQGDSQDEGDVADNNDGDTPAEEGEVVVEEGEVVVEEAGHAIAEHAHSKRFERALKKAISPEMYRRVMRATEARIHAKKDSTNKAAAILARLKEEGNLTKEQEHLLKEEARLDRYAENNALAVEFFPIGGTSKVIYPTLLKISGVQTDKGTLKPFDELTTDQKAEVQKVIVSNSYKATLIHELGHNLGLRHNFMGSWDKDNFYTDAEAQALGMEAAPAYSSIMDYSFSEYNQLKAFGKYDLAALRFGYANQVELKNGQFVEVKGSISKFKESLTGDLAMREYQFCTDENAGLSSTCNRFDEGTNLVEVSKHLIKRYKDYYKYRNFRDGRLDFSAYDLPSYVFARMNEFTRIRDVMEEYEFFAEIFGPELMQEGCTPQQEEQFPVCKMINDRRDSVKIVGDFFIEVLKTPDHLCALALPEDPTTVVAYKKLYDIYDDVKFDIDYVTTSCFDPKVKETLGTADPQSGTPALIPVGETGKFLNGFKDMDPNYKYVTDRFVLGTWPDKVMAFNALFRRTWGKSNTDRGHMSLMDLPYVKEQAQEVLDHMILGKPMQSYLPFTMEDGKKFSIPYAIQDDYKVETLEDYFTWLRDYLGLPVGGGEGNLLAASLTQTRTGIDFGDQYTDAAFETRNMAAVIRQRGFVPEVNRSPEEIYYYDSKARTTFSANEYSPYAFRMISALNNFETLEAAGRLAAAQVVEARNNPEPPQTLPAPAQVFWLMNPSLQNQLIQLSEQGADIPQDVFTGQFGPQIGPLLFAAYQQGADFMKAVLVLKEEMANTPPADASDEVKALYNLPVELIADYAMGLLTEETLEYYKKQLLRMPNFLDLPLR